MKPLLLCLLLACLTGCASTARKQAWNAERNQGLLTQSEYDSLLDGEKALGRMKP